ncbi:MAG: Gfo/Idh/MocA family oxidoreductase [Planctomycetota bacterium]|nr:Gfo/Idh/MocA family oxidoreductase [Planctomycetota bacterium]
MAFLPHIPGTRPIEVGPPHPQRKGVGVLGLHEGRTLLLALNRCTKAYPVAACDVDPDKLAASRAELPDLFFTTTCDELLARPEVDIIAIYTPDAQHADHVVRAFEAGKDVICTKPLVNSIDGAKRMLAAGRRTGRRLLVGQSTRFFEPFMRQRRALERGEFGGLQGVELVDAHYIHRMDWFYRKSPWAAREAETDWVFLGLSHPLDLIRWYLGHIREVHTYANRSAMGASFGLEGRDIHVVNLVAEDGRIGRAMGHYGCHELPTARNCIELMLYGTGGSSLAQYHDMKYIHTAGPDDEMTEITEDHLYAGRHYYFNSEVHGMHYGEFANYAESFAGALIDGSPCSPDLEEGVETFCVMEAVKRSAQTGRPVEVRPLLEKVGL